MQLDFIRPGRPVENAYIESFNGRLRDEGLNVHVFFSLADVREKLERWRQDYNQVRPHSALGTILRGSSQSTGGAQPEAITGSSTEHHFRAFCLRY